jgi:hypothetical protein
MSLRGEVAMQCQICLPGIRRGGLCCYERNGKSCRADGRAQRSNLGYCTARLPDRKDSATRRYTGGIARENRGMGGDARDFAPFLRQGRQRDDVAGAARWMAHIMPSMFAGHSMLCPYDTKAIGSAAKTLASC